MRYAAVLLAALFALATPPPANAVGVPDHTVPELVRVHTTALPRAMILDFALDANAFKVPRGDPDQDQDGLVDSDEAESYGFYLLGLPRMNENEFVASLEHYEHARFMFQTVQIHWALEPAVKKEDFLRLPHPLSRRYLDFMVVGWMK